MNRILRYLKSPKSDFLFLIVILILINLISYNSFVRFDMTSAKSYSLSKSSVQLVKTLEQPLSVQVFFSSNLPAPYSNTELYLRDLLSEYKGKANKNFSVEFFDMNKAENQALARNYGLNQIQIRELKDNEVGFKQVWMGLAMTYSDRAEIIDAIASEEGLEYKLTTKISEMIATTSALSGLKGKVKLTLFKTEKLSDFAIAGFSEIDKTVRDACQAVNKENMNRIEFAEVEPESADEINSLAQKYGIQRLEWSGGSDGEKGSGILGLVLEYEDKFRTLPLRISRTIFAQNYVTGLDDLEAQISENLSSLVSRTEQIGYIVGHGELDLDDEQIGAARLQSLLSDRYVLTKINLSASDGADFESESDTDAQNADVTGEIPSELRSVIINGATESFSDSELYKLDQFLMRGGNLIIFADSFKEVADSSQSYYGQPTYEKIDSGLSKLLNKHGIEIGENYVLDKNCYTMNNQQYGAIKLNFAPMLRKSCLSQKSAITKNLAYVITLQASSIEINDDISESQNRKIVLAKSSEESWLMSDNIILNPLYIHEPDDKNEMESYNLAILAEGRFKSAFENEVADSAKSSDSSVDSADVQFSNHLSESVQSGKIFVTGSSKLTTAQLIDEEGTQPAAIFVRNVIDYMNGEEDLCEMRTKGLSLNTLNTNNGKTTAIAKYFNQIGLVILVVIAGFFAWISKNSRRKKIKAEYNPFDRRDLSDKKRDSAKENN